MTLEELRRELAPWGAASDDDQFVAALVAAGIGAALLAAAWGDPPADLAAAIGDEIDAAFRERRPAAWLFPDAAALEALPPAEAAAAVEGTRGVRLAIAGAPREAPLGLLRALTSRPDTGAFYSDISDRFPSGTPPVGTVGWPLRVAFTADGPTAALRGRLGSELWHPELAGLVDEAPVDLLVSAAPLSDAAGALAAALDGLEQREVPLVLVLGPWDGDDAAAAEVAMSVAGSRCSGVHLCDLPDTDAAVEWFNHLVDNLAHDAPADKALRLADQVGDRDALPFLTSLLVATFRLSFVVAQLRDWLAGEQARTLDVRDEVADMLRFPRAGPTTGSEVSDFLSASADDFLYDAETHEATALARLVRAAGGFPADLRGGGLQRAAIGGDDPEPEPPAARVVNGDVLRDGTRQGGPLEVGEPYTLVAWIGAHSERSITRDEHGATPPAFPDEDLPPEATLDVVFVSPTNDPQTQRQPLVLPEHGDSGDVEFVVRPTVPGDFFGRLAFLHRGRILQTAVVTAGVGAGDGPDIVVEAVVHRLDDLADRSEFDLALVVNRDARGAKAVTAIRDDGVDLVSADGFQAEIEAIVALLAGVADRPDDFAGPLDSPAVVGLLYDLAQRGVGFANLATKDFGVDPAALGRLQVLSAAPDSYLPVELFYAARAPSKVELCTGWQDAVRTGECAVCPTADYPRREVPVCPAGFWGLRYVVERHAHNPDFARLGADFRIQAEPTASRRDLDTLGSVVFAVSKNVFAADHTLIADKLTEVCSGAPPEATRWDDLEEKIGEHHPTLILLVPHTDQAREGPGLEIGGDELLPANQIGPEFVRADDHGVPVVVLLGCETASPAIPFQGFVPGFRQNGAAVVISTIATVLGRHAAPVAAELLATLAELRKAGGGPSLGDALRQVRRDALAQGYVMVLTVVAYGDADWRLR